MGQLTMTAFSGQSREDAIIMALNEKFAREKELLAKQQGLHMHCGQDGAFQRFEFKDCIERPESPESPLSEEEYQDAQTDLDQPNEQKKKPRAFGRLLNWMFKN